MGDITQLELEGCWRYPDINYAVQTRVLIIKESNCTTIAFYLPLYYSIPVMCSISFYDLVSKGFIIIIITILMGDFVLMTR